MRACPRSVMARRIAAAACSVAALPNDTLSSKIFVITLGMPGWNDRTDRRQTHRRIGSASILPARTRVSVAPARYSQFGFGRFWSPNAVLLSPSVSRFGAAASQTLDHFRRLKHLRAGVSARLLPLELHAVARLQVHASRLQRIRLVLFLVDQAQPIVGLPNAAGHRAMVMQYQK